MSASSDLLTRAFHAQQRGEVQYATEAFVSILRNEPDNLDALQLLGINYLKVGRVAEADQLISRAIGMAPNVPELYNNRALCRMDLGRANEARADLIEAIRLRPAYPEAFNNLGLAADRLEQFDEAEAAFIRAIGMKPNYPSAFLNLAATVLKRGRAADAASCCRRALALQSPYPEAEATLGIALERLGRIEEAELLYRQSLDGRPHHLCATGLGRLLRKSGRSGEAEDCLKKAIALMPNSAEAHRELGFAQLDLGRFDAADASASRALEIDPGNSESHTLVGSIAAANGRYPEAEAAYLRALELDHDNADAHCKLANLHLLTGRWKTGWKGSEWRHRRQDATRLPFEQPAWDGSPLEGRTILLWPDATLEGTIQLVRYARLVKARGGRPIIRSPRELGALLRAEYLGADRVLSEDQPLPSFDVYAMLSSLPAIFGTMPDSVPAEVPYVPHLELEAATWEFWQDRLERFPGARVGVFWRMNGAIGRSVPAAALEALLATPGVSFIDLELGKRLPPSLDRLEDLGIAYREGTLTDAAAVMAGLDLVIGIDSSIVHLAGAMGLPVWAALSFTPDGCWLLDAEKTPWYPTMRLFRQPSPGAWDAAFVRLGQELNRAVRTTDFSAARRRRQSGFEFSGSIHVSGMF